MVATNVDEFNLDIARFRDKLLPEQFALFHRKLVLEALSRIIMRTPVKTGRARGNWQVSIDSIADEMDTERLDASGEAPIAQQRARATSTYSGGEAEVLTTLRGIGHVVILSNNLPYIMRLEHGHSKEQAPHGMVALTLAELVQMVEV